MQKTAEQIKQEMDSAALVAERDLKKLKTTEIVPVAHWLKTHYLKAGYKRLARMLIAKVS